MSVPLKTIPDYRNAFAEFAQKLRQARALMAATNPDWQAIDAALLNLEKARLNYNHQRDILAQELLVSSKLPAFQPPASDSVQPESNRVRAIAELRWELAGKPDGRDDDNWYRAEEILRRATAA